MSPVRARLRRSALVPCQCLGLCLYPCLFGPLSPAWAQDAPGGAPTLPPVVVTGEASPPLEQQAGSASRLGLTVRETPASIEVLPGELLRERGLRSVTEAAEAAVGVLAADFPAEPANFSMRGFANSQLNTLYNGIKIGPPNMSSRVMDVANLERIEFLKGPASLMSGEGASGGAVNFVTRAPQRGPVQADAALSAGSFGAWRSSLGAGGTTALDSLDFRADLGRSAGDGHIDDTGFENWHLSGGLDWYAAPGWKLYAAAEYKRDDASAYWGTPLVSAASPGVQGRGGIVSGRHVSAYNGSDLGAVTIDRRTLRTNYNVVDNRNEAQERWLRAGAEAELGPTLIGRTLFWRYTAQRTWLNNEVIAFDADSGRVDRERFYVAHDQTLVGNKTELQWDAPLAGRPNRLVAAFEWSDLDFVRPGAANFPGDSVDLVDPQRGRYGLLTTQRQTTAVRNTVLALEDRLRLTPSFALLAGLRHESIALSRTSTDAAGAPRSGFPFDKTFRPTTWRLGATWDARPGLTAYGQAATAADVAANNLFLLRGDQPLELSRSRSVEIGLKQSFDERRGQWTAALYDIVRRNVYAAQGGRALALAGRQVSRGLELSAGLRPVAAWQLWGQLALNRTRYRGYTFDGGSYSGNTPPNVPRLIASAGARWRAPGAWPVELGGSVRHVGSRYHSDANTVRLEAYTVADVAAELELQPQTRLGLRVRNLFGRRYAAWADPFYPDQILLGAPRSLELSLQARF